MQDEPRAGKGPEPDEEFAEETKEPVLDPDVVLKLTTPNIWSQPPVGAQPRKVVSPWSVYRATPKDGQPSDLFGLHFVGRDLREWNGCVSSKIASFVYLYPYPFRWVEGYAVPNWDILPRFARWIDLVRKHKGAFCRIGAHNRSVCQIPLFPPGAVGLRCSGLV